MSWPDGDHRSLGFRNRARQAVLAAAPTLAPLACALPVASLAALLGGIDGSGARRALRRVGGRRGARLALAIAISVEVIKTDEVIMAVLAITACWLLSLPLWGGMSRAYGLPPPPRWFHATNPFVLVYAPYASPGRFGLLEFATFVAAALAMSAGLLAVTIARLRRFVLPADVCGSRKRTFRIPAPRMPWLREKAALLRQWRERLPGPSLDGNPVLWREWHRARPSRMARIIWRSTGSAQSARRPSASRTSSPTGSTARPAAS